MLSFIWKKANSSAGRLQNVFALQYQIIGTDCWHEYNRSVFYPVDLDPNSNSTYSSMLVKVKSF